MTVALAFFIIQFLFILKKYTCTIHFFWNSPFPSFKFTKYNNLYSMHSSSLAILDFFFLYASNVAKRLNNFFILHLSLQFLYLRFCSLYTVVYFVLLFFISLIHGFAASLWFFFSVFASLSKTPAAMECF